MSAQCQHGLIRYGCWKCRDDEKQSAHVAQVFAGGLVRSVEQIEALEEECRRTRQERYSWRRTAETLEREKVDARAEVERLRAALEQIAAIENKDYGIDWDEIEEAREIAKAALAEKSQP